MTSTAPLVEHAAGAYMPPKQKLPSIPASKKSFEVQNTLPSPGIAACMRLNAKLTKRVVSLATALGRIAGPTPCGGAMTEDEEGEPFSLYIAESVRIAHARHCVRCVARAAIDPGMDFGAPLDDPTSVGRILAEVRVRREEQDEEWGGPEHDDKHGPNIWVQLIKKFATRAGQIRCHPCNEFDCREYDQNLIDVAALSVAAIQSSRRKRNAT